MSCINFEQRIKIAVFPTFSRKYVLTNREDVEYGYVIEEADKAMYYAKERGKNTYHILKI